MVGIYRMSGNYIVIAPLPFFHLQRLLYLSSNINTRLVFDRSIASSLLDISTDLFGFREASDRILRYVKAIINTILPTDLFLFLLMVVGKCYQTRSIIPSNFFAHSTPLYVILNTSIA